MRALPPVDQQFQTLNQPEQPHYKRKMRRGRGGSQLVPLSVRLDDGKESPEWALLTASFRFQAIVLAHADDQSMHVVKDLGQWRALRQAHGRRTVPSTFLPAVLSVLSSCFGGEGLTTHLR